MLLFNIIITLYCIDLNYLNTSYVTVQHFITILNSCTYYHLNTSYVTVQPPELFMIAPSVPHLNTSYVTVQLKGKVKTWASNVNLNTSYVTVQQVLIYDTMKYSGFKYILCYCSTY